jgi:midasin (ATPase involved in ribosome maturation)
MSSKIEKTIIDDFQNYVSLSYALNYEIRKKKEDIHLPDVFNTVDMYIRESNLGQYEYRLLHIRILHKQMETLGHYEIANILYFILQYYSQFVNKLKQVMKSLEADTEEHIKTIVDVSKWNVQKFESVS